MKESNFISPTAASPVAHRPYDFSFACLSAGTTSQIDGSLSACRAGGVGVVDLISNIDPPQKRLGEQHLRALLASCAPGAACGVRICATQLLHWPELLSLLASHPASWILLTDWQSIAASELSAVLSAAGTIFLEISNPDQATGQHAPQVPFTGWLACPTATGDGIDSTSAFVLIQALSRQHRPFLVMDIAGPEAIAAARIGGASGVVLREAAMLPEGSAPDRSVARAFHRLRAGVDEIRAIVETGLFAPGSSLARDHGTEFPIVQGPMTQVSDCSGFARVVAENGALPMLALALHSASECLQLMRETVDKVGERPWGVGLLGFAPPELLEQQLTCVHQLRPPFCVLSGGRPDQVARLEREGTATYLHVPVPELIAPYFKRGVRRFVFEGSECGGHTGPLTSFGLWGQAVEALLALTPHELREVSVLFAGGIHDALSSAMASAFAARLAARGAKVGILMGTAYLFTEEIVTAGAVVPAFQAEALRCGSTTRVITGRGHMIRCAPTPFIDEFSSRRAELEDGGHSSREVSEKLEALTLGRARAASRGLWRNGDSGVSSLSENDQRRLGMYMMGEVAAFRDRVLTVAELHRELSPCASSTAQSFQGPPAFASPQPSAEPIAIIGMSGLVPGATTLDGFWRLLIDGGNPISEIPPSRFDWRMFFDENAHAKDKIYSRWGGFLDEVPFDPISFGIPPLSLHSISPLQLLALEVARRALADAGYGDSGPGLAAFDRENTSLSLGVSSGADLHHMYITRSTLPACAAQVSADAQDRLPEWTEESFPGNLMNVIAGRIANRFDLGGSNRTIDAACASSLAAIQIAVADLQCGRTNLAITGGIDLDQTVYSYMAFSKTHALSPRGIALPFDRKADGIVLSEGVVLFVLKRLSDAEREGDRIYAVIRSVEGSSDGRGKSLTAPRPAGQRHALNRAYAAAGFDPASLGLYEAHGTGTVVGDRAELETVSETLKDAGAAPGSCAIGSAKGLLGHTKSAAGAVGLMKTALALHHRVLPPLHSLHEPLDPLLKPDSPLCSYDRATPWLTAEGPRHAGVSAFGFGGTNFHAALEEYTPVQGAAGADAWPCELFLFAAPDADTLIGTLDTAVQRLKERPREPFARLAFECCQRAADKDAAPIRMACVAAHREQLRDLLTQAKALLAAGKTEHHTADLHLQDTRLRDLGDVVFLFPGQGSQYVGMGRELALYTPEMRSALEFGDRAAAQFGMGPLSRLILPPNAFGKEGTERQAAALTATDVAQPAIGLHSCGLLDFARRLGLRPSAVAGHSYGEFVALHAAGVISREDLLRLSIERGLAMRDANRLSPGAMVAASMSYADLRQLLPLDGDLTVANFNSPRQCVLSGSVSAIERAMAQLQASGTVHKRLPVDAAFHSPAMASAALPFARHIDAISFSSPSMPVYSNFEGRTYPGDDAEIRSWLKEHLCRPVHFEAQIRAMYKAGARTFVEIGPREVLTGLTSAILTGEPHQAVSLEGAGGSLRGCLNSLATFCSWGVPCNIQELFVHRHFQLRDEGISAATAEWFVDGGRVRHRGEPMGLVGAKPLTTIETARELPPPLAPIAAGLEAIPHSEAGELLQAYNEYQQTMRGLIDSQERILFALLDRVQPGDAISSRPVAIAPPAAPLAAATEPAADLPVPAAESLVRPATATDITAIVLAAISRRTGYPPEFLNLDYDIEADIGVDSIKRIDILLEIEGQLPSHAAQAFEARMNDLNQFRTIRSLVGMLEEMLQPSQAPEPPSSPDSNAPHKLTPDPDDLDAEFNLSFSNDAGTCPRFAMRSEPKRLANLDAGLSSGLCVVTADDLGVAPFVVRALEARGLDVALLSLSELESYSRTETRLADWCEIYGRVSAILHLASLTTQSPASDTEWEQQTQVQLKSLLQIVQHCAAASEQGSSPGCTIVAATGFGGLWCREHPAQTSCLAGGVHGLLRTAQLEHPQLSTSVVDFDPTLPPEQIAEHLVAELCATERDAEAGYRDGERFVFSPQPTPQNPTETGSAWTPSAGSVIVLTGGARGITAQIAENFARPGVHLVLLGRGSVGEAGSEARTDAEAIRALRDRVIDEARDAGRPLRPATLEAAVQEELHRRERAINLERLRARGAEVTYEEADMLDPDALRLCLRSLYRRFGRIDAVVHGAGVLDDTLLLRKSMASFDRVFRTKTAPLLVFEQELQPDSLRLILLFSSISGRFGNAGQCDYAAANEVLVRWAWLAADRWPNVRALAVCWGPWLGAGMAADSVLRGLRERGILSIDPQDASRFLQQELAGGGSGCEVIAGDGFWRGATPSAENAVEAVAGD